MAVETAADRAAFCNSDEFGDAADYQLGVGGSKPVSGIFDNGDGVLSVGDAGVVSVSPRFICPTASLPAGYAEGDTLTIGSVDYTIASPPLDDGTGMTEFELELA